MNERQKKIMVPYEEKTDTCPDCSKHPCDCGLPAGYTPTPRTDKLYRDYMSDPYQDTGDLAAIMHIQCERLERELTAVTEQRDRLTKAIEPLKYWRDISECNCSNPLPQGGCLRCDLDKTLNLNRPTP